MRTYGADIPNIEEVTRFFYLAGLAFGSILLASLFCVSFFDIDVYHILPPCIFHELTHFYCPGCGGTRACVALLHGEIGRSLLFHPVVFYTVLVYGVFLLRYTVDIFRGKSLSVQFRPIWFYLAAVLTVAQWLFKNFLLFYFHFDLLSVL